MKYVLICLLFLTGCATKPVQPFIALHPDKVEPISVESPEWVVANAEQLQTMASQSKPDSIYYVLQPDQFSVLMDSLIQISDKMKKQDIIIQYYETVINNKGVVK